MRNNEADPVFFVMNYFRYSFSDKSMLFFLFCITDEKNIEHYFLHVLRMNGQGWISYSTLKFKSFFCFLLSDLKYIAQLLQIIFRMNGYYVICLSCLRIYGFQCYKAHSA